MIGSGTIVNALAVVVGGGIGLLAKGRLHARVQDSLMKVMGVAVFFVGSAGALSGLLYIGENGQLQTSGSLLMIVSLAIGMALGEWWRIEDGMERLGERLKGLFKIRTDSRFVEGFVTNALVICIGAMAVVGSLQDGLEQNPSMLYTKALMDAILSMVFAASLGVGVLFAAIPLFLYQGSITLLSSLVAPYFNDSVIHSLSYVGSVLIACTGINLLFGKTIRVGNMLPALLIVLLYGLIVY